MQGTPVAIDATTTQTHKDRIKAQNAAVDKRAAKARKTRVREEERQAANRPDEVERRNALIKGLRRKAKEAGRSGKAPFGETLSKFANTAERALEDFNTLTKDMEAKRLEDPVGTVVKKAAKELCNALPVCFPNETDALVFAEKLPLMEPRGAAVYRDGVIAKMGRDRAEALRQYWQAVERGSVMAAGNAAVNIAVQKITELGLM